MTSRRYFFTGAAVLLLALAFARPAAALDCPEEAPDDPAARRALAKKWFGDAQQRQTEGDELGALHAYQCSLKLVPHAFTAYNLGKLAEKTGDLELAVDSYRAYLRLTPEAPDAAQLETRIVELETRVGELRALQRTPRSAPTEEISPPPPPPPAPVAQPIPVERQVPAAEAGRRGLKLAWVAMGTGTALLATGVIFNLMARSKVDDGNRLFQDGLHDPESNAAFDKATTYAYTSYALLGTGAAAALSGVALYLWQRPSGSTDHAPALSFAPLRDGAAVFATGRF